MIMMGETLVFTGLMKSKFLRKKVINALKKGKVLPICAFGVFEPQNPENLYDIIPLNEFRKDIYKNGIYKMIGLTGSKLEAMYLSASLWMKKEGNK